MIICLMPFISAKQVTVHIQKKIKPIWNEIKANKQIIMEPTENK